MLKKRPARFEKPRRSGLLINPLRLDPLPDEMMVVVVSQAESQFVTQIAGATVMAYLFETPQAGLVFRGGNKPTVRGLMLPRKLRQLGGSALTGLWVYLRPIVLAVPPAEAAPWYRLDLSLHLPTMALVLQ